MPHHETNPHFSRSRPLRPPPPEDGSRQPGRDLPMPPGLQPQQQGLPGQPPRGSKRVPVSIIDLDDDRRPRVTFQEPPLSARTSPPASAPPPPKHQPRFDPEPGRTTTPTGRPLHHDPESGRATTPTGKPPHHAHKRRGHGYRLPAPQKTKAPTWFAAVCCVIFWLVIIIGGLIVLIVYLVFRPQSPRFDVTIASLNAAYLDMGYLLNADLRVLANFTNPNKKVHVDFSSVIIDLYYGSTRIATQYVEPFSAAKKQSRFADIHLVTSQVRLPVVETQRLMKQIESNGVLFEVKGVFRARSKFGSILKYSYNLYGHCSIMLTRPPDGVLIRRKCRTKR